MTDDDLDPLILRRRRKRQARRTALLVFLFGGLAVGVVASLAAGIIWASKGRQTAARKAADSAPVPSPPGFEKAWDDAVKKTLEPGDQVIESEGAEMGRAIEAMALSDKSFALRAMKRPDHLAEDGPRLLALGLGQWVFRVSSTQAIRDPRFKDLCRRTWDPELGRETVGTMMDLWGINPPEVRDEIATAIIEDRPVRDLSPRARSYLQEAAPGWAARH